MTTATDALVSHPATRIVALAERDLIREAADRLASKIAEVDPIAAAAYGDSPEGSFRFCVAPTEAAPWVVSVWDGELDRMRAVSIWATREEAEEDRRTRAAVWPVRPAPWPRCVGPAHLQAVQVYRLGAEG